MSRPTKDKSPKATDAVVSDAVAPKEPAKAEIEVKPGTNKVAVEDEDRNSEESSDQDFNDLKKLLDGYTTATPKGLRIALEKARRLEKCSSTVQLVMLMLNIDHFNMGEDQ